MFRSKNRRESANDDGLGDAPEQTLVAPEIAQRFGLKEQLPIACFRWNGKQICGPTARFAVRIPPCSWLRVDALVTPLAEENNRAGVVVGRDYLKKIVRSIDGRTGRAACRRR